MSGSRAYFSSEGMVWKILREKVIWVTGPAALLMQIAHPKVARAVFEHSRFRKNRIHGFNRLSLTFTLTNTIVFCEKEEAQKAIQRIRADHATVKGKDYRADDPHSGLFSHRSIVGFTNSAGHNPSTASLTCSQRPFGRLCRLFRKELGSFPNI